MDASEEEANQDELNPEEGGDEVSDAIEVSQTDTDLPENGARRPIRRAAQAARKLFQDLIEDEAL